MGQTIDLKQVFTEAGGYSVEAYAFIRDGLAHTVEMIHGDELAGASFDPEDESRHVDGSQLCIGLRDFAIDRYGLLARHVLGHWGIHETADFGKIIFALVDAGLMRKTDDDTLEDFRDVFEFEEVFSEPVPTQLS